MRIGILTFHYAQNYGAVLQTFALMSKLKELGHVVTVIDRQPDYTNILRSMYHCLSYKHFWGWLTFSNFSKNFLHPRLKLSVPRNPSLRISLSINLMR